jgi:hypothetical protein
MNEVAEFVKNFAGASKEQHKDINEFLNKKQDFISTNVSVDLHDTIIARSEPENNKGAGPDPTYTGPRSLVVCADGKQALTYKAAVDQG